MCSAMLFKNIWGQVLSAGIAQCFSYFSVVKCAGLFFV